MSDWENSEACKRGRDLFKRNTGRDFDPQKMLGNVDPPAKPHIDFVATYKVPRESLMSARDWLFVAAFVCAIVCAFCAGWKLGSMRL